MSNRNLVMLLGMIFGTSIATIVVGFYIFFVSEPIEKKEYVHPPEYYYTEEGDRLYVKRDTTQCIEVTYQRTKPEY